MLSSVRAATLPLVGRQRELRQLDAALRACIEDKVGETFLLRGEAGIGKTRLVEELGRRAATLGAANHRALILDFGMESHAEPIPSLLRLLLGLDTDAGADDIEACVKACLGRLWHEPLHRPALHALFRLPLVSDSHRPLAELSESARRAASRELLQGLVASQAQARPRLLVVEDIHWADPHTLALLADLADAVSRCAAVLVITSRVEGEPLDPGWRSAMHGAPLTTLDLGPLPETQAWQLAQGISEGDSELIQRCIERSGGNPFFLQQLLWGACDPEDKVPDSVQSLVLARLDMLGDADRLAARAASVLGQRFRPDSLRHLLQDEGYQPDALLEQRLIRPEVEGYLFVHALLRDAIYDSLLATQRRALHLRASDWYRERDPALYARHLDLAGDVQAAQAYLRAAQWALPAFDFEQALALATRGLEIAQASDLRAELGSLRGDLLIQAGAIGEANAAYGAAAAAARDDRTRCRALIGLAAGLTVQDALDQALELLDQAAPLARASGDDALQTELHYRRGDVLFALGRVNECLDAHRQAQRHAKAAEAPLLEIRAQAGLADAYYARGRMRTAWNHFHRCVELARREQRLPQELGNLSMRGLARFYAGSVSAALSDAREAAELAAEYRNLRAELIAHMSLALVLLYTEDVEGAKCAGRRGLELARQLGASRFFADNLAAIGEALALQGEVEEGVKYLERAYRSALDSVPTHIASFVLSVLARVTPDDTRRQQAITEGKCWLDRGSLGHNHLHFYQNLIDVSLNRNDPEGAAQYAQALDRFTQAEPLPWSDFYIARGRLLAEVQQQGVAAGHLQQARQLLETARSMGLYVGTRELAVLVGR
jgi:predicted ATPase